MRSLQVVKGWNSLGMQTLRQAFCQWHNSILTQVLQQILQNEQRNLLHAVLTVLRKIGKIGKYSQIAL